VSEWPATSKCRWERDHAKGVIIHTVVVTIDDHETVLSFESKEQAEAFAQVERARLSENKGARGNKRPVEKGAQAEWRSDRIAPKRNRFRQDVFHRNALALSRAVFLPQRLRKLICL
jgi:hypothetical protein